VERTDLGRIEAFTDGVMAVAITLLVLNLEVPTVPGDELDDALVDLIPSLIAYLLSFVLVGRFWIIHHRLFETLRAFDSRLMTLNLAFLTLIVLVPFATELFDRYTQEPIAAAVLGGILGLAALTHWLAVAYTLRRSLVHDEHRPANEPLVSPLGFGFTALFLLSVPVAFLSPTAASVMWVATVLLHYPLGRMGAKGVLRQDGR
jgi:TMEM175 potassium channel family protein